MPTLLSPIESVLISEFKDVLNTYERFKQLVESEIRFDLLAASRDDNRPPLKLVRCRVICQTKITGPEERARDQTRTGRGAPPDVRIKYDIDRLVKLDLRARAAVFAESLYCLTFKRNVNSNEIKLDSYGRPVMTILPMDWVVGGYVEVYEWYGSDSQESRSYERIGEIFRQGTFKFMKTSSFDDITPTQEQKTNYDLSMTKMVEKAAAVKGRREENEADQIPLKLNRSLKGRS